MKQEWKWLLLYNQVYYFDTVKSWVLINEFNEFNQN